MVRSLAPKKMHRLSGISSDSSLLVASLVRDAHMPMYVVVEDAWYLQMCDDHGRDRSQCRWHCSDEGFSNAGPCFGV
jgi:hypothetical protein